MKLLLPKLKGTTKVDLLNKLADMHNYINVATAIEYANQGLALARQINYEKGIGGCYGSLGHCYISLDNSKALDYTQKALQIRRRIKDRNGIANSLNVMGLIYYFTGNYLNSIEYQLQALKIREELGDKGRLFSSYNNISLIYMALEDYDTALYYLNKALTITVNTDRFTRTGLVLDNIGVIHTKLGKYKEAFNYFFRALEINRRAGYKKSEANSYKSLADAYKQINDTANSLKHYESALKLYKIAEEKNGIAIAENGIASIYQMRGNSKAAISHAETAYNIARSINSLANISDAASVLQNEYDKLGDYKKAFQYLTIFNTSQDSLHGLEKVKKLAKLEFDYRVDKIKKEQASELSRQRTFIMFLIVVLLLLSIIIILIIMSYRNKKNLTVKLSELNTQLQESNSAKDRFFSIIGHDLRGPFQSLLGITQIFLDDAEKLDAETIREYSRGLNNSLHRQLHLLDDLLNWSRLQNSSFKLDLQKLSPAAELSEVIKTLSLSAEQKQIKLVNNLQDATISADKNMLNLVFRNLISNAIKFSKENTSIEISSAQTDKILEITISDQGVGISEEAREKLFKSGVTYSTAGTKNESGSGLGLVLCKEIIEKHSGNIWIESEVNKGSKFIFTLPLN